MERIPEKLVLTEDDIKEAIQRWLASEHDIDEDVTITFHVEHKQSLPNSPYRGGMSDFIDTAIITATVDRE